MTDSTTRNPNATGIDINKPLTFKFDNRSYTAYEGDTLASALLANGIKTVGRSFKYHRPRGILSAGSEEPNALVELNEGYLKEPNTRATMVNLEQGIVAKSQNRWPNVNFDLNNINNVFSPFLSAGFYYKTFMWPKKGWLFYEKIIRKAAGLGTASRSSKNRRYEKSNAFCDVLIIGGGVSGISAAIEYSKSGKKVIIADENCVFGGMARYESDSSIHDWINENASQLTSIDNIHPMSCTTVFGAYDGMCFGAVENINNSNINNPTQRFWRIHTDKVIYATGALERPLVFGNNDLPGIMLAYAMKAYVNYYGVVNSKQVVVFSNNDSVYDLIFDLLKLEVEVCVVDCRGENSLMDTARDAGAMVYSKAVITDAHGHLKVKEVTINQDGLIFKQKCDQLAISGGWVPNIQLQSHCGRKPVYDSTLHTVVMLDAEGDDASTIGSAAAIWDHNECIRSGESSVENNEPIAAKNSNATLPTWCIRSEKNKCFVDFQNDVTLNDIKQADDEGFTSSEHLKRYTTLGMATDQGKTANLNAIAILAEQQKCAIEEIPTTTYRPPYSPVSMGAFAGRAVGSHFQPIRRTPIDNWNHKNTAVMLNVGLWQRAHYYPVDTSETVKAAYIREMKQVRENLGICDVSTLGKIIIQGSDALAFINRVYVNDFTSLNVNRVRYGIMLREDGIVYDDGTVSHLGENEYLLTTTTANAASVLSHLEYLSQIVWPQLNVQIFSVTDQFAAFALAGPLSRKVLEQILDEDVSDEALPFMGFIDTKLKDVNIRLFRISFSGELAYEINVAADYGESLWKLLLEKGSECDLLPYGTEAMGALRIEKGHVTGAELDGRTTMGDIGFQRMLENCKKEIFIGQYFSKRKAFVEDERAKLVGLIVIDDEKSLRNGAQLLSTQEIENTPIDSLGHITSVTYSPELDANIALAFIKGGLSKWQDKTVYAHSPLYQEIVTVKVVSSMFIDAKGERLRG